MNRLYTAAIFGLLITSLVVSQAMGGVTSASGLTVPTDLMIDGGSQTVGANWKAIAVELKWDWDIKSQGHSGGKFQNFAVIPFPSPVEGGLILFSNPRRDLTRTNRIGTLKTNLFDDPDAPCIGYIQWSMLKPSGQVVVGRQITYPGTSPYPGYGLCP